MIRMMNNLSFTFWSDIIGKRGLFLNRDTKNDSISFQFDRQVASISLVANYLISFCRIIQIKFYF